MNEQLIKFIELCLTDGVITDKEREVIFRKASEYNVDIDECEIILESMIQQKNMSQTVTILKNEIVTEVNTEINNSEKYSSLLSIYSNIYNLWNDSKYLECINEVKKAEPLFKDLFKDRWAVTAKYYLWSLMEVDLEKAYEEIDRVTNLVEDKLYLQNIIGRIYQEKGTKTNDLTELNKALHCFKSYDYDSEYQIENVKEIINRIVSNSNKELEAKLKSLGVNSEIIKQFTNNDYKKLWKVSCLITEPYYNYIKNTISNWQNSNPNFFIPSNGIINEKGAVAFIKANWTNIYVYRVDKYWEKKGSDCDKFKSFDKTKIEIIEINEIV